MSAWNFGREEGGNQYGWDDEPGWNFNALDDDNDDWQDPFGGLRDWSADSPAHSPFTNTRTAPPSRPPARNDDGSRANDTSFLDGILHATAPRRRRPEPQPQSSTDAQDTLTRRHPADLPRETYRPTLSQTTTRQPHSDHRPRQGTFGYIPNALVEFSDDDDSTPQSTRPSTRVSDRASEELVTLEDTDEEDIMPITRRCNNNGGSATVDLTSGASASTSQQRARGRKRSADSSTTTEGRATKRGRTSQEDIEEIDLSNDAPSAEEELLQQRQKEAIKLQQASEEDNGPFKIGQRTCIICMENFTNCTIASCGHFYCHECLIQALLAGEKNSDRGTGTCPQCRKPLSRNNKKKRDIILLSFMKKETFRKNQQKRLQAS